MQEAQHLKQLSTSAIAAQAEIDQGQASRILRGEFRTLSCSVMQICRILDIDAERITGGDGMVTKVAIKSGSQDVVVNSALNLWDGTPEDAQALARLFSHLGQMRIPRKKPRRMSRAVRNTR